MDRYEGKTIASVVGPDWEEGLLVITITFTDGTTMRISGCGCCDSPLIEEEQR